MTLVVDASVAIQWSLEQQNSARAIALRTLDDLIAPSLIAAEIGNAVWKAIRRHDVPRKDAQSVAQIALEHFSRLTPLEELQERALEIAIDIDHPIYDCFYLALAERERCPLVTDDKRLVAAGKRMKGIEVRAL